MLNHEATQQALLRLDGIPKVTYLVRNGKVFVFEALVREVMRLQASTPAKTSMETLAHQANEAAWVSASEAVRSWGICPWPYRLDSHATNYTIVHSLFEAMVPRIFEYRQDALGAMETLLMGGVVPGEGDIQFRGQPLRLLQTDRFGPLPARPRMNVAGTKPGPHVFARLADVQYEEGFKPLTRGLFDAVVAAEADCADCNARIERYAYEHVDDAWGYVRRVHPVPQSLTDQSIADLFMRYQTLCQQQGCWALDRDEGFIFYLLGSIAVSEEQNQEEIRSTGEVLAYLMGTGATRDQSIDGARVWRRHVAAVNRVAAQVSRITSYLRESRSGVKLSGPPVSLFMELENAFAKSDVAAADAGSHDAASRPGSSSVQLRNGRLVIEQRGGKLVTRYFHA